MRLTSLLVLACLSALLVPCGPEAGAAKGAGCGMACCRASRPLGACSLHRAPGGGPCGVKSQAAGLPTLPPVVLLGVPRLAAPELAARAPLRSTGAFSGALRELPDPPPRA